MGVGEEGRAPQGEAGVAPAWLAGWGEGAGQRKEARFGGPQGALASPPQGRGADAWKAVADTCGVGPRPTPGAHAPHALLPLDAGGTCDWLLTKSDGCT